MGLGETSLGQKATCSDSCLHFDVDRKGKASGGWQFSSMVGSWRSIAAFQVFYSYIVGMSREKSQVWEQDSCSFGAGVSEERCLGHCFLLVVGLFFQGF